VEEVAEAVMPLTDQEFFDQSVRHIIKQGKPSVNDMGSCKLRGVDGTKCVVGHFIPDDKYESSMEDGRFNHLLIKLEVVPEADKCEYQQRWIYLISRMQFCHDHASKRLGYINPDFIKDFKTLAQQAADEFNLDASVLHESNAS
jgi:hypothetical protein